MTAASVSTEPVGSTSRIKRRRWYAAALLSFVCPGLGQIYNTQGRRALAIVSLFLVAVAVLLVLSYFVALSFGVFIAMIAVAAVALLIYAAQIVDAGVRAWRMPAPMLKRYNRIWVYLLAIVALILFDSVQLLAGSKNWNIPSGAMLPTLEIGDYLVAEKGYFAGHDAQYGDIAVFKLPTDGKTDYIKRIVGLPGDTIQMIGGRLHINGTAVERARIEDEVVQRGAMTIRVPQYIETLPGGRSHRIREERGDEGMLDNTSVYRVPEDHYFAMGDNRDNSQDSRILTEVGFVPRANLRDRPGFVYWSRDRSRIGLRVE
jgi:signal peptidase I